MLRTILISPNEQLNVELATALAGVPEIEVVRVFTTYPSVDDLLRTVRHRKPDFLFVCIEDLPWVEALATHIDDLMPGLPMIALCYRLQPDVMPTLMRLAVRECLAFPITHARLAEVVVSIQHRLRKHQPPSAKPADLYTFLPAKPGVGCTTIAVSASCALADDFGARALLVDCDLSAGAIKFLLKLGNTSSVVDAIAQAERLDEDRWSQLVEKWDSLDVLHAGELNPPASVDLESLHVVLSVARTQYTVICADLASSLDRFSLELMRESRRIFVVTTPEVVPLHFAGNRIRSLARLGLSGNINLLVNRKPGRGMGLGDAEVARIVGLPVAFTFSNDYNGVEKAILRGSPVARSSDLGHGILNLARSLTPHLKLKETSKHRRFLDFFPGWRAEEPDEVSRG